MPLTSFTFHNCSDASAAAYLLTGAGPADLKQANVPAGAGVPNSPGNSIPPGSTSGGPVTNAPVNHGTALAVAMIGPSPVSAKLITAAGGFRIPAGMLLQVFATLTGTAGNYELHVAVIAG